MLGLLAAALTGFAGWRAARLDLGLLRGHGAGRPRDQRRGDQWERGDEWSPAAQWSRSDHAGDYEPVSDTGSQGVYRDGGLYRTGPAYETGPGHGQDDTAGPEDRDRAGYGWHEDAYRTAGYGDPGYDGQGEPGELGAGYRPPGAGDVLPAGYAAGDLGYGGQDHATGYDAGRYSPADYDPDGLGGAEHAAGPPAGPGRPAGPGLAAGPDEPARSELYGQIAIYTLLEDRVAEFDRLSGGVVEQVRADEPDTLVYIVHAVPSAPMQRILYEVYRDRAAYEEHRRQPYVTEFDIDRRPYVLATNVIELGLQQAKVSPFPSVAELFGEPACDTSGFERPDYLRDYGKSASGSDPGRPRDRR